VSSLATEHTGAQALLTALRILVTSAEPGARLPSTRTLQKRYGCSPATVQKAVAQLKLERKVVVRPGSGTFVAMTKANVPGKSVSWQSVALGHRDNPGTAVQDMLAAPGGDTLPLSVAYLDPALQPHKLLRQALTRVAKKPGVWSNAPLEGIEGLRAWFADEVGADIQPFDVQIVSGGQAALTTVFRALTKPGQLVLVESPTYLGATAAIRVANCSPMPVPVDRDGVRPDYLADAFRQTGASVFYCQPLHANPSGACLSAERRRAVIEAAEAAGAFIVEDDYTRGLTFRGEASPPLVTEDSSRVVYLRSLSKLTAPSLRVAAICAKGPAGVRIKAMRAVDDLFGATPLQEVALELVTSSGWARHLKRTCAELLRRCEAATRAVTEYMPGVRIVVPPSGGLHLWLQLPDGIEDRAFAAAALEARVSVKAGSPYFPVEPPAPFLRLSFAAAGEDMLEQGIQRLGKVLAKSLAG